MKAYKRRPELLSLVTSYEDCTVEITKQEYISIVEGFMKFISGRLLDGISVVLPASMGTLSVFGRKQVIKTGENGEIRGLAPDWKKTKELWDKDPQAKKDKKVLMHFNEHSRGIRYKFGWSTTTIPLVFKTLLAFRASRANKRALWKRILDGTEYQIIKSLDKSKK